MLLSSGFYFQKFKFVDLLHEMPHFTHFVKYTIWLKGNLYLDFTLFYHDVNPFNTIMYYEKMVIPS